MEALLNAYREDMGALYTRWLSPRKRSYYKPLPDPPSFAALEGLTLSTVTRAANWAAVELLPNDGHLDFRFNLICRCGEWRITSYQQRYHSACRIEHWSYSIF